MSALMQRTAVPSERGDVQMIAALKCETYEFPLAYKVRECKYCRSKSWIATPMAQETFPTWDPLVPWNQGNATSLWGVSARYVHLYLGLLAWFSHCFVCQMHVTCLWYCIF
jgi:hypothetical protein